MKLHWIKKALICLLLLPTILLSGCWQDTETEDADLPSLSAEEEEAAAPAGLPKSLALPYQAGETLDPVTCPDGTQQTIGALLYEGLFELNQTLEPQPKLCANYTYDGQTLTCTLRTGVTFSDGTALTARDVVSTLQRAQASTRYASRLSGIQSIAAVGDSTVVIALSTPNTRLPALLDIPIVKAGTENSLTPVGTGPYLLVQGDDHLQLKVRSDWWGKQILPVDTIQLVTVEGQDSLLYEFASHNIQLITADLTGTNPISVKGDVLFTEADTTILQYVGFHHSGLFSDPALRKALSLGIDRSALINAFLSGHGKAAQFPISPVSPLYPDNLNQLYSYDQFVQAMTDAGWNTGTTTRTVTLLVNEENTFKVSAAKYVASALSVCDLKIEVKTLPWAEYLSALQSGSFDLYYGEVRLSADWNLSRLIGTSGSLNYGKFSDPQVDQLLAAYASSVSPDSSMELLCSRLQAQTPILPLCFKTTSVLSQNGVVENLTPTAGNPFYDFSTCIIHLSDS